MDFARTKNSQTLRDDSGPNNSDERSADLIFIQDWARTKSAKEGAALTGMTPNVFDPVQDKPARGSHSQTDAEGLHGYMIEQPNLFDRAAAGYPNAPGFKARPTSQAAAKAMAPRAPTLRDKCLAVLKSASLTADEVSERLGITVLSGRPRVAELARMCLIKDTGETRINDSGKAAIVWSATATHGGG